CRSQHFLDTNVFHPDFSKNAAVVPQSTFFGHERFPLCFSKTRQCFPLWFFKKRQMICPASIFKECAVFI
ncbi:MAG: hypothetical protein Q4D81_15240, partial [Eubacteriales bacterium]|nr:hypothetical protein [Eubacteriales bacterium]